MLRFKGIWFKASQSYTEQIWCKSIFSPNMSPGIKLGISRTEGRPPTNCAFLAAIKPHGHIKGIINNLWKVELLQFFCNNDSWPATTFQVWFVSGNTRNIAIRLVLHQCRKTSCTFSLPVFPYLNRQSLHSRTTTSLVCYTAVFSVEERCATTLKTAV